MALAFLAVILGLVVLVWSADRFIAAAAYTAQHFRVPPLLIGMIIVGFGTSLPEMTVSAFSAWQGSPGIALGNAYGSNIVNIALILGMTALIMPMAIAPQILRKELPLLAAATALAIWQLSDGKITRFEAFVLLGVFAVLMTWMVWSTQKNGDKTPIVDKQDNDNQATSGDGTHTLKTALMWTAIGLALLVISSRVLVWGAVTLAERAGVSDLIIGLTVVALGTSLPELASSVIAARKGQNDIALGNIVGSNFFNTLVVVGLAGLIHPMAVGAEILQRDILVMALLTFSLFIFGLKKIGGISRVGGGLLLACYFGYTGYLVVMA